MIWRRLGKAIASQLDEIALAVGLGLVTVGLWPSIGVIALLAPGLAIVWVVLPARGAFIVGPRGREKDRT